MVATPVQIAPSDMRGGRAADFSAGHLCPIEKSLPCSFCDRNPKDSSKNWIAVAPLPMAGATSRRETFGFQRRAAETCAQVSVR